MKRLFAALLFCFCQFANAAPACSPVITDIRFGLTSEGLWSYWYCPIAGDATQMDLVQRVILFSSVTPQIKADFQAYLAGKNPTFVTAEPKYDIESSAFAGLVVAMNAAIDNDPPQIAAAPTWTVLKNGTSATRPSFAVVNGARSFSSKTTAVVGSACDCSAIKLIEGQNTFCQVAVATVAACTKTP